MCRKEENGKVARQLVSFFTVSAHFVCCTLTMSTEFKIRDVDFQLYIYCHLLMFNISNLWPQRWDNPRELQYKYLYIHTHNTYAKLQEVCGIAYHINSGELGFEYNQISVNTVCASLYMPVDSKNQSAYVGMPSNDTCVLMLSLIFLYKQILSNE